MQKLLGLTLAFAVVGALAPDRAAAQPADPFYGTWRFTQRLARAPFAGLTEAEILQTVGRQIELSAARAVTFTRGVREFSPETCTTPQYQISNVSRARLAADYRIPQTELSLLPAGFQEVAVTCRGNLLATLRFVSPGVAVADVEGVFFRLDRMTASAAAASTGPQQAAAPARPSFDCARAQRADEKLICEEQALARADGELGQVFQRTLNGQTEQQQGQLRREQRAWILQRNQRCQINNDTKITPENRARLVACLANAYTERRRALEAALAKPRGS
jgi:uncharacterized protein YecT (DUF1311 family)